MYFQSNTIVNDIFCKLYFQVFNLDHALILQRTPKFKSYCLPDLFADENSSSSHLMGVIRTQYPQSGRTRLGGFGSLP